MANRRSTVLIVDDDPDFVRSTGAFLEAKGYEVLAARGGAEGLATARRARPDVILMDVMMGERTEGFFAIQELRRDPTLAETPVIVVSSLYSDVPGFRVEAQNAWLRHDEFLPKPVDLDLLLDRIRARLGAEVPSPGSGGRS